MAATTNDPSEPTGDGSAPSEPELLHEVRDGVATLTINRPERRNALSWDVVSGMRDAVAAARTDPDVRVVVITGAGDRAFCAGADLTGMRGDSHAELHEGRGHLAGLFEELWALGKPTVAKVRGYCLAGGFGLALSGDPAVGTRSMSRSSALLRSTLLKSVIL